MHHPYHSVCVITTSYPTHPRDWTGHFVREEALELARAGLVVTVLATRPVVEDAGIDARDLSLAAPSMMAAFGPPGAVVRMVGFPPRVISAAMWVHRVSRVLERERFDRVIAHWAVPSAWPASQRGGLAGEPALEVVSHGSDVRLIAALPRMAREHVVASIVTRAVVWRFVSTELLALLVETLRGELASRVRQIAVVQAPSLAMLDVSRRARALRQELGAFDVSVGRLLASKRVEKAIEHTARKGGFLVVVGDGPERRALERRAERARARVMFVGDLPRDETLAYVAAADALVFASEEEGLSTVVREARALDTRVQVV